MPLTGITIDGPSTRDIDDGIWIECLDRTPEGWVVTVVISDVSKHIRKGSSLDQEAQHRVASRYFANGSKPMLPLGLAEDKMSLIPGKYRRVLAARISLDNSFQAKLESLTLEGFKSKGRIDYPNIPGVLGVFQNVDIIPSDFRMEMVHLASLANNLMERRRDRGALAVYDLLQGWVTTEEGFLKQMKDTRETIGYIIVQEMMILTNSLIAEWCVKEEIPVLFRNHTSRPAAPPMAEVNQQIKMALQGPWQDLDTFRKRIHMLLDRADYGTTLRGHVGLSLPAYLHFTSPLRRYADLINHRQIRAKLTGKKFPHSVEELDAIALHINESHQVNQFLTREHFKDKAEEKAESALDRGRLTRLNDKEFERVLKVEFRAGNDARKSLQEEFLARLEAGTLPPICMVVICFPMPENVPDVGSEMLPGWKRLRDAVLWMLQEKPELAVTLWTLAVTHVKEEPLEFQEKRSGPPHAPVFAASAKSGLFGSGWAGAGTAKVARQRAAVWLLFRYHDLPERAFGGPAEPEPEEAPSKPRDFLVDLAEGRDPVVALQEYAQKHRLTLPGYSFKQEGPSHIPKITCTCSFNKRTGVGSASNKSESKKLAAKELVDNLVKEHGMG